MKTTTDYPEINAITTVKACRLALRMGYNNLDSIKPEHRPELQARLDAIEDRMRRLAATEARIRVIRSAR